MTTMPGTTLPSRSFVVFALTGLGAFLVSLDVSVANSLLPSIGGSLGLPDRATLSWVITAYAITFAAALVPAGRIADRAGRRRIFLAGLGVFGVGSLICGLASGIGVLVAGRIVQGVGAAAASPASLGLLLHCTPGTRRAVATARWGGMGALGMGLGPVVGGVFTEWFSWRGAFLVNVPLVAAAMLAAPGVLVESDRHPGRRLPEPIGAVLFALAASGVTFALAQVADWGVTDVRVAGAGLGATLAGALFVRRCLTVSEPLLDLAILRSRQVAAVTVVTVLYSCAFFGLLFSFVLFLAGSWHLSLIRIGAALVPMAAPVLLLTVRVGQLANRVGFRLPLTAGTVCMAGGLVLSARAFGGHQFELRWLPIAVLIGVGIGLCYPLLGAAAVAGLDARHLAAATALNQCARQLGAALGVATTVAVLGGQPAPPLGRFHIAWLVCAGFCAVAGLTARTVNR